MLNRPVTLGDYLASRVTPDKLSKAALDNALSLIMKVNELLEAFGEYRAVTSGVRTIADHKRIYKDINAKRALKKLAPLSVPMASKHLEQFCQAIDLEDADEKLDTWLQSKEGTETMERLGLYAEHPDDTKGWSHLQALPPKSGNRFFHP